MRPFTRIHSLLRGLSETRWLLGLLAAALLTGIAMEAQANVIVTAVETPGGDVLISGGGTLNLAAWTTKEENLSDVVLIAPGTQITIGPTGSLPVDVLTDPTLFSGSPAYGFNNDVSLPDAGSGDIFGLAFSFDERLTVPTGYVSGNPLMGSSTYEDETFASLGMTPGSYSWSWGSDDTASSFTLEIVPEPSRTHRTRSDRPGGRTASLNRSRTTVTRPTPPDRLRRSETPEQVSAGTRFTTFTGRFALRGLAQDPARELNTETVESRFV